MGKHCWFTQFDLPDAEEWDKEWNTNTYKIPACFNSTKQFRGQYDAIMSVKFCSNPQQLPTLKALYPKIGHALKKVYDQYQERKLKLFLFEFCRSQWKNLDINSNWSKYTITVQNMFLENGAMAVIRNGKLPDNTSTVLVTNWKKFVSDRLIELYEDRIVIMTDMNHGLMEFSKLLVNEEVPHAILQIEGFDKRQIDNHKQLQLCEKGFDTTKKATNGTSYMDDDLIKFVNAHNVKPAAKREERWKNIPVIMFNSDIPEGVSLYNTRYLHILTMNRDHTNISQMMGRINRLCKTTKKQKEIYMYVYEDSDEKTNFLKEESKRQSWTHLN
jgi:hypothetical protein